MRTAIAEITQQRERNTKTYACKRILCTCMRTQRTAEHAESLQRPPVS